MFYSSTVIKGLLYDVDVNLLTITMFGKSKTWELKNLDKCIEQCQDPRIVTEIYRVMEAYKYTHTRRKDNLDAKLKLMKILDIQYGELQTKILKGELNI